MNESEILRAIELDDAEALKSAAANGSLSIETKFEKSRRILHLAAISGASKVLDWALAAGADPNAKDSIGSTPLILASVRGVAKAAKRLLDDPRTDVDSTQNAGRTAIMMAAFGKHVSIVEMLLKKGADLSVVDKDGISFESAGEKAAEASRAKVEMAAALKAIRSSEPSAENAGGVYVEPTDESAAIEAAANNPNSGIGEGETAKYKRPADMLESERAALKKLEALGFENLSRMYGDDPYSGREAESDEIVGMLGKNRNVMILGAVGSGKTSLAMQIAGELAKKGKILLQVPSTLFRGDKYQNSVKESMEKWLSDAFALQGRAVFYFDEAHVLGAGAKDGGLDTPMEILKEYIDDTGDKRVVVLAGTTPKLYERHLGGDESFTKRFVDFKLPNADKTTVMGMLTSDSSIARLERQGYVIGQRADYERVCKKGVKLLEQYIFNQAFPKKAFDFVQQLLKSGVSEGLDNSRVEEEFGKFYSIPIELIRGTFQEGSRFLSLGDKLKEKILGQEECLDHMVEEIIWKTASMKPSEAAPVSFMLMGPTGVGKTETALTLAAELQLPHILLKMSEFKTVSDIQAIQDIISDHMTRNYSGVIIFDEVDRANKQALDILLNLLDKGVVGNGAAEVRCGNQIIIATTNIGDKDTVYLKRELESEFGSKSIDEDWLRARLIEGGLIAPTVMRISKVIDYNAITPEIALRIGTKVAAQRSNDLHDKSGVLITVNKAFLEKQILSKFDEEGGARGIKRSVEEAYKRIIGKPAVIKYLKQGTEINIDEQDDEVIISIRQADGFSTELRLGDSAAEDKRKLKKVFESMKSKVAAVEGAIDVIRDDAAMTAGDTPKPSSLS